MGKTPHYLRTYKTRIRPTRRDRGEVGLVQLAREFGEAYKRFWRRPGIDPHYVDPALGFTPKARSANNAAHSLASAYLAMDCPPAGTLARMGHSDWRKLQACLYILRNPRPAYRTRDVRAHLAKLGIGISSLDFRRFTKRPGIRRDERAGRPRGHRLRDLSSFY